jgi:hypothetical protein
VVSNVRFPWLWMMVDSPWSDQSLFVEEKSRSTKAWRDGAGAPVKTLLHGQCGFQWRSHVMPWLWDGYGMDGSCHMGNISMAPFLAKARWHCELDRVCCLCWGQHLWESILAKNWRPYFWDGRIDYYQVDFILEMGHLSSKNGVHHPSFILFLSYRWTLQSMITGLL